MSGSTDKDVLSMTRTTDPSMVYEDIKGHIWIEMGDLSHLNQVKEKKKEKERIGKDRGTVKEKI